MKWMIPSLLLLGLSIVGCDQQPAAQTTATDAIPATLILASAPAEAQDLNLVKPAAKQGDEVIIRGVIGGREAPIAANRAILTIVDPSIETCDKMPGDTCTTPWDACCVDQQTITAGSATVQVVDAEGRPLRVGLNGHRGIAPLKEIVVVGKVRGVDEKSLIIDATGIYVKS